MTALSHREAELLEFIVAHVRAHGFAPSFDEMAVHLDLQSKSGVSRLLTALEEKRFVRRLARRARGIEVLFAGEGTHRRDCQCGTCRAAEAEAKRQYHLTVVRALQTEPPAFLHSARLSGIRLLSKHKRAQVLAQVQPAAANKSRPAVPSEAR